MAEEPSKNTASLELSDSWTENHLQGNSETSRLIYQHVSSALKDEHRVNNLHGRKIIIGHLKIHI